MSGVKAQRFAVIIPTKDRPENMRRVLPKWLEHGLPVHIIVEEEDAPRYQDVLIELDLLGTVGLNILKKSNMGTGYVRWAASKLAVKLRLDAFVMSDDDVHIRPQDDPRQPLRVVASQFAMAVAGWTGQYGLWVPNGNEIGRTPGRLVPLTGGPDRVYALNPYMAGLAGGHNHRLVVFENVELNRCGVARLHKFWYASSSWHIINIGKRDDPGGIVTHAGGVGRRHELEQRDHEVMYALWPKYVTHFSKRYGCQWKKLIADHMGAEAAEEMWAKVPISEDLAIKGRKEPI